MSGIQLSARAVQRAASLTPYDMALAPCHAGRSTSPERAHGTASERIPP
jgi:hypothetical protein